MIHTEGGEQAKVHASVAMSRKYPTNWSTYFPGSSIHSSSSGHSSVIQTHSKMPKHSAPAKPKAAVRYQKSDSTHVESSKPLRKTRLPDRAPAQNATASLLGRSTRQGSDAVGATASIADAALSTPAARHGHGTAGQAVRFAAARGDAADVAVGIEAVARLLEEIVILTAHAATDAVAGAGAAARQTTAWCCFRACWPRCCVTADARQAAHADVCCRPATKVVRVAVMSRSTSACARGCTCPAEHGGEETRRPCTAARCAFAAAVSVTAPRVRCEARRRRRRGVRSRVRKAVMRCAPATRKSSATDKRDRALTVGAGKLRSRE
ncbi:uncharacterized protein J3D65DRAFT_218322 [Phyllosticta citribraziliensis]|uniref:Uncharacterized protein n=1 Tax=Phyllosticta citribraziliensis TaxID=989973 RepID=A0ABR1M4J8_9PEZI